MPTLTSISELCAEGNLSGLFEIEYLPTAWVNQNTYEKILSSVNNWQYDIELTQGSWLTAGLVRQPQKKIWSETENTTLQGPTYEQSVSGITPKMKPAVTLQFEQMSYYRFLLRVTDANGQKWILGTLDQPFDFSAASVSGSANQYRIGFESVTSRRAHGFVPVL